MITPECYADLARRSDPKCSICRGMGYAYYRQQDSLSVGERIVRGLPLPDLKTYESACECLSREALHPSRQAP